MDVDEMWFQQDSCGNTGNDTMDILHERFKGTVISRELANEITPSDFFVGFS